MHTSIFTEQKVHNIIDKEMLPSFSGTINCLMSSKDPSRIINNLKHFYCLRLLIIHGGSLEDIRQLIVPEKLVNISLSIILWTFCEC